jgi:cyclophilin family peptidyl-prolyl cis-trans isomerase
MAWAGKLVLQDGRELEGDVIVKGEVYTIKTTAGKLFQFHKPEVKSQDGNLVNPEAEAAKAVAQAAKPETAKPEAAAATPAAQPAAQDTKKEEGATQAMKNPVIKIATSKGDITVELFEDKVPNTVANMISLAESGFYKGMKFHRIITDFMAQGGCPNSKAGASGMPGTGGPGYKFADEINPTLKHDKPGILSMANAGANTNGSQFFLCFKATPWLNGKHAVFGQVTAGLDVLKKLEGVGSQSGKTSEEVTFDIQVISKNDHPYVVKKL